MEKKKKKKKKGNGKMSYKKPKLTKHGQLEELKRLII